VTELEHDSLPLHDYSAGMRKTVGELVSRPFARAGASEHRTDEGM
jgi:hypothetical protein